MAALLPMIPALPTVASLAITPKLHIALMLPPAEMLPIGADFAIAAALPFADTVCVTAAMPIVAAKSTGALPRDDADDPSPASEVVRGLQVGGDAAVGDTIAALDTATAAICLGNAVWSTIVALTVHDFGAAPALDVVGAVGREAEAPNMW